MALIDGYIAKLSQEDIDRLNDWVDHAWKMHWKDLASKSNSRAKFREYVFRDNKNNDELLEIGHAIRQQAEMWRKQSRKEKVMGIPHLSSWYNAARWTDDISHDNLEHRERQVLGECKIEGCSNEVHGPSFDVCAKHVPSDWTYELRQAWKETGLDRNSPTLREDCRAYINKLGYGSMVGHNDGESK